MLNKMPLGLNFALSLSSAHREGSAHYLLVLSLSECVGAWFVSTAYLVSVGRVVVYTDIYMYTYMYTYMLSKWVYW